MTAQDHTPGMRLETVSENIARDMKEGRFPEQSPPQMVHASPYKALSDLISKRLLGIHHDDQDLVLDDDDWRLIINALSHYAMTEYSEPEDASARFGRALTDLPRLAAEAGCHVGITVTAARAEGHPNG